jgi:hypothetical protein
MCHIFSTAELCVVSRQTNAMLNLNRMCKVDRRGFVEYPSFHSRYVMKEFGVVGAWGMCSTEEKACLHVYREQQTVLYTLLKVQVLREVRPCRLVNSSILLDPCSFNMEVTQSSLFLGCWLWTWRYIFLLDRRYNSMWVLVRSTIVFHKSLFNTLFFQFLIFIVCKSFLK